jgi:hypothetical protein
MSRTGLLAKGKTDVQSYLTQRHYDNQFTKMDNVSGGSP